MSYVYTVCVCVCGVCVCVCIRMHACVYVCMHVCMCIRIYTETAGAVEAVDYTGIYMGQHQHLAKVVGHVALVFTVHERVHASIHLSRDMRWLPKTMRV